MAAGESEGKNSGQRKWRAEELVPLASRNPLLFFRSVMTLGEPCLGKVKARTIRDINQRDSPRHPS